MQEESPVTGRVIAPPQQLISGEEVRLNIVDPTNGQADFLVGTVTEDGQGVQISRIPEGLAGLSQQATDATTATSVPRRMPSVGDVVPLSVAERDFARYGFRPEEHGTPTWPIGQSQPQAIRTLRNLRQNLRCRRHTQTRERCQRLSGLWYLQHPAAKRLGA